MAVDGVAAAGNAGHGIPRGGAETLSGFRGGRSPGERRAATALETLYLSFDSGDGPRRAAAEDRAVAELRAAVDADPADPAHRADLALAHLVRGSRRRDALDLLAALEAVDLALDRDRQLAAATFVRALTVGELALWAEERAGWERVLALGPGPELTAAAGVRLAAVEEALRGTDWEHLEREMRRAAASGDPAVLAAAVDRHPELARELGEEVLLAEWAEKTRGGARGVDEAPLDAARALGTALARGYGEHLLADTVAALDRAGVGGRERLAAGIGLYAAALPALARWSCTGIEADLVDAADLLAAGGAPLARWPRFHRAVCAYQRADHERAYLEIEELVAAPDAGRYPALLARALGVQAVIQLLWGDHAAADHLYQRAVEAADEAGSLQRATSLRSAHARARDLAGDEGSALALRLTALSGRADCYDSDREYVLLAWTASGLRDRWPRQALPFQREAVTVAERGGDPVVLAEAYRGLALVLARLGASAESAEGRGSDDRRPPAAEAYGEQTLAALAAAEDAAGRVEDPAVRQALELDTGRFAGEVLAAIDPLAAASRLDAATERAVATDYRVVVPGIRIERARLALGSGDPGLAEVSLRLAIDEAERQRLAAGDPEARIAFADLTQDAYELLAALLLDRGEPESALEAWEEGRTLALLDRLRGIDRPAAPPGSGGGVGTADGLSEVAAALPAGTALVEYAVLGARVEAWVIAADGGITHLRLPSPAEAIANRVQRFRQAMADGAGDDELRPLLSALHRELVAPLAAELAGASDLVVVPHRHLAAVPFPALLDAATGHYLIEERTVRIVPSARAFAALAARAGGAATATDATATPLGQPGALAGPRGRNGAGLGDGSVSALVVGDPAFDRRLAPNLPRLPGAGHEAGAIAGIYGPDVRLLVDELATAEAFARGVAGAGVVHLAAHARVDRERAGRSALLLARPAGAEGRSRLGPDDLFALDLSAARLVVLAVCEGAAGPESASEGPLSLVRPFLAKGVPSVVAGLWPIEDGATAELMIDFHRRVAAGTPPAVALAQTQRALLATGGNGAHPIRFWAAFQSYGTV